MHLFIIETSNTIFFFFFFLVNSGIGDLVYKWKFGINVSFSSSKIEVKKNENFIGRIHVTHREKCV